MFIPDPGSELFHPRSQVKKIPDPVRYLGSELFYPGSQVKKFPDPGSTSKNLCIFNFKKWVLSSRKYDPKCSSRIRIKSPDLDFLPIPDTGSGSKKAPDPGSGSATLPPPLQFTSADTQPTLIIWASF
jgi:hypothetical protein